MSKHTPGPWSFGVAYNGDCGITASGTGIFAEAFADIRTAHENARDEARANARLIVVAPDLLVLVERYMAAYPAFRMKPVGAPGSEKRIEQENLMALEDSARAIIAKATGAA